MLTVCTLHNSLVSIILKQQNKTINNDFNAVLPTNVQYNTVTSNTFEDVSDLPHWVAAQRQELSQNTRRTLTVQQLTPDFLPYPLISIHPI